MRKSALRQQAFSLVETLVVLAIMSVLAVWTVSSVSSLKSTALSASGNHMVDVFAMARQNSISKNVYTAVVIKTVGTGAGNAYCLLQMARQDDGTLGAWTALAPWHYLSTGIAFEPSATFILSADLPVLPQTLPTTFPFQGQQIDLTSTTAYQCYQPDGTLISGSSTPARLVLRLIEGKVDSSSGTSTLLEATNAAGQAVDYYDLVFVSNTGMTKIERP